MERNRRICFEEKEMMNWTFQNGEKDNPAMNIAEDYVRYWDEMKKKHMGYLLWDRWEQGRVISPVDRKCFAGARSNC